MATFTRTESLVEAIQYDGNNMEEVAQFINGTGEYTAIMDFNETWVGYLLNRYNTVKRVEKVGQWIVLEGGQLSLKEDEEFTPRYTNVKVLAKPVDPWASVEKTVRVIEDIDSFPLNDHDSVWVDDGGDVWFWSDEVARDSGDERCGWTWLVPSDYGKGRDPLLTRAYAEPMDGFFPLKEYVK